MQWEHYPHWLELASQTRRSELLEESKQQRLLKHLRAKRPNKQRISYQLGGLLVALGARLQNRQVL